MSDEMRSGDRPFLRLLEASRAIRTAIRGHDILVLENDDEMLGYVETPLEKEFCDAATTVIKALQACVGECHDFHAQNLARTIEALVNAHLAAEAYRSRMFKYTTDWGSEVSPIANASRRILNELRAVLKKMNKEERQEVASCLSESVSRATFTSFYWIEWDQHGSEIVRVNDLLD